jgi:hypothetical protein
LTTISHPKNDARSRKPGVFVEDYWAVSFLRFFRKNPSRRLRPPPKPWLPWLHLVRVRLNNPSRWPSPAPPGDESVCKKIFTTAMMPPYTFGVSGELRRNCAKKRAFTGPHNKAIQAVNIGLFDLYWRMVHSSARKLRPAPGHQWIFRHKSLANAAVLRYRISPVRAIQRTADSWRWVRFFTTIVSTDHAE